MEIIQIAGNTDVGQRRKDNQDAFICKTLWSEENVLMAVIDGVGGYAGGDVAAAIAKDSILQYMESPKGDTLTMLREAVIFANNQIAAERKKNLRYSEMCCVITAAVADASAQILYFVHVGDTRLYRFRDGMIEKLTKDHSLVGIREDAGDLSEEDAMNHPQRNIILRDAGSMFHRLDDPDFLDYEETDFIPGDILMICSDGLSDMINKGQIISVLRKSAEPVEIVHNLIEAANEMGGFDNITVVLARYKSTGNMIQARKETQLQAPNGQSAPEATIATPILQGPGPKKVWPMIIVSLLVLGILALAGLLWWRNPGKAGHQIVVDKDSANLNVAGAVDSLGKSPPPDSLKSNQLTVLPFNDTFYLVASKRHDEILKFTEIGSKYVVLIPATEKQRHLAAIEIVNDSLSAGKDSLILKNLIIKGFDTGIRVRRKVFVLLENIIFEDVKHPISYEPEKGLTPGDPKDFVLKIESANK